MKVVRCNAVDEVFPEDSAAGIRFRKANDFRRSDDDHILHNILNSQTLSSFESILKSCRSKSPLWNPKDHLPVKQQLADFFENSNFSNYYQIYDPVVQETTASSSKPRWLPPALLGFDKVKTKPPVFKLDQSKSLPSLNHLNSTPNLLTHMSCNRSPDMFTPNRLDDHLLKRLEADLKKATINSSVNLVSFQAIKAKVMESNDFD